MARKYNDFLMNNNNIALVIDCRMNNQYESEFYTLNIWGKPCFLCVCEMVRQLQGYRKYLLSESEKIRSILQDDTYICVDSLLKIEEDIVTLISGTAIFLKRYTLTKCISQFRGGYKWLNANILQT